MFSYHNADFVYEPYPICYVKDILPAELYEDLTDSYPDKSEFDYMPRFGKKYSLAEKNNKEKYYRYLKQNPQWNELFRYVKSKKFIEDTLEFLESKNIDLGYKNYSCASLRRGKSASLAARVLRKTELRSRFEFSILDGDGGCVLPHTDSVNKIITLVVSMIKPNEWDPAWGGSTQVCLPKDRSSIFNHMNKQADFDDVEVIKAFEFVPNQCILFIKTYNSWHQVAPLTAPPGASLRKTLTIVIEKLA
jgi:hypothetical protein